MQEEMLGKTSKEKVHTVLHCLDDVRCMRLQEDLSLQDTTASFEFKAVKHHFVWTCTGASIYLDGTRGQGG